MTKGKIRIFLALFVSSVFLFQSCMTILRGRSQEIPVTSNPIGAKILVDGEEMGNAPLYLKLKRKKAHIIRIEKEGYNPLDIAITKKGSILSGLGASVGNVLLGSSIGTLIGLGALVVQDIAGHIDDEQILLSIGIGFIGAIIGTAGGIIVDLGSGATYTLSPEDLNVTLTKIGQKPQPNIILIDAEKFQEIKWIRIKCVDNDEEDIINLD